MLDINKDHLAIIKHILNKFLTTENVWVFGSRATNSARKYSDLDLALEDISGRKIDIDIMLSLQSDFAESDLPWSVDVIDLNNVSDEFKNIINKDKIRLIYL